MKVFLRGKLWWGSWSIDGQRSRVSSGTSNEKLAKEILAKMYSESFREKTQGIVARKTWAQASARYLQEHQHLKSYRSCEEACRWWTQQFKRRQIVYVDQITPDVVRRIRDEHLAEPLPARFKKTQRTAATVNRGLAYLRAVVNAVYREYQWCGQSAPPLFRMLPGERERIRYITPEEFGRLIGFLPENFANAARLAVSTGLRRANVFRLRWDQVDLVGRVARIDGVLMKNGESLNIPLNDEALEVLRLQSNDSEWVFPGAKKNRPSVGMNVDKWKEACAQAGLEDFHWHDLRHTWASWLRQGGASTDTIQQLGGWKTAAMVMRYAHLSLDHLRGAASLVDSQLGREKVAVDKGFDTFDTNLTQSPPARPYLRIVNG
jgi:integrase